MKINKDLDQIHIGLTSPVENEDLWMYMSENLYSSYNELGSISTDTGVKQSNSNFARTIKGIPVESSTIYTLKLSGNTTIVAFYYTKDKAYINYEVLNSYGNNGTFTTPATCNYVKFRFSGASFANAGCMLVQSNIVPSHETYFYPQIKIKSKKYGGYIPVDIGIVDSGANDNWIYIKFADGTMICTKSITGTLGGTAWGNVYYSDHSVGSWAETFITIYNVIASTDANQYWCNVAGGRFSSVRVFRPNSGTTTGTIRLFAIGSWR